MEQTNKKLNVKQTLRYYWQHTTKYKISFLVILLATIASSLLNVIIPLYLRDFFDILSSNQAVNIIYSGLIAILLTILGLKILEWVTYRLASFFIVYLEINVLRDLSMTCFKYLHKHSFKFFHDNFVGSLTKKVNFFARAYEGLFDRVMFNVFPLFINIAFIAVILFKTSYLLGLGIIIWLIIYLAINALVIKHKIKYDIAKSKASSKASGVLSDTITNQSNVKLFNAYNREVSYFGRLQEEIRKLRSKSWNFETTYSAVQALLALALEIGALYFAIRLWKQGLFTIGDFVLLQNYAMMIIMKIWNLGNIIRRSFIDLSEAEEMTEILLQPHGVVDVRNATKLSVSQGVIEFKEVDFCYNQTRRVLKKLNLVIKPKEKIALVGPSGAGKTTIVELLLRNYDVSKGKILIDNQNISQVTQDSLHQNIALVRQESLLFHRSIKENIKYGKSNATDKEVERAAKLANCHTFIKSLEKGYGTYVGERGVKLSGGEKQRVSIARAILYDAPIIVLDEATSSLDSESEKLIQDALENLMKNKTVIVIAHRLSTIKQMDRIIVVDNGQIEEIGSHEDLLKRRNGLYQKLWRIQTDNFV